MRYVAWGIGGLLLLLPVLLVVLWVGAADDRLAEASRLTAEAPEPAQQVAVAAAANESYCTPELKQILRRVLQSCGLIGASGGRGCQPVQAKNVATMRGDDFNALFTPMQERGGIIQFDRDDKALGPEDHELVDRVFADRRGASYFFVVARASPEGSVEHNRELSRERAEAVMGHLQTTFADPELERQVGLLWLGEEYAQLAEQFCDWNRSGAGEACAADDLNRSAFVTWIDCRL